MAHHVSSEGFLVTVVWLVTRIVYTVNTDEQSRLFSHLPSNF